MNPFNSKVRSVIRREYMQRVRSKWFLLSTVGIPLLFVGLGMLSGFLAAGGGGETDPTFSVGVIDRGGQLADLVVAELLEDSVLATRAEPLEAGSTLNTQLLASDYDAFLVLPETLSPAPAAEAGGMSEDDWEQVNDAELLARDNVSGGTERSIRRAVNRALVGARLREAGVEGLRVSLLTRDADLHVVNVSEEGAGRSQDIFKIISVVLAFLFYMVLILYGQMIIRSVIEEKTSDIVEVVISSMRPWELMLGKIVGVGAVGISQFAVWGAILTLATVLGRTAGASTLAEAGVDLAALTIPFATIGLILALLVLGYLLYAGLFAAAGATIGSEQDAQQVAMPIVMLIVVPFIAVQGIIESPSAGWAVIMSIVPFFSPLLMPSRLLVSYVPVWQWAASLLLLVLTLLGVAWVAGRIYRIGILMKGQRPNLPEVLRWVRHG